MCIRGRRCFIVFRQETAYEMLRSFVGSEMGIRDRVLRSLCDYKKRPCGGSSGAHG